MEEKSKKCQTIKNERTTNVKTIHRANLISYVITAIIFTIILTVGMSLLLGEDSVINRIKLTQAKKGETTQLEIEKYNENLPENTKGTEAGTEVKIPSEWLTTTSAYVETEDEGIVEKVLVASNVNAIATGNGETVPVPKGFYYVGGTVQSGVVISDNKNDQNKYVNYEATEEVKEGIPAGVVYNLETGIPKEESELSEDEKKTVILGNQFVWIPVKLDDYKKEIWKKGEEEYQNGTWETQPHSSELTQIRKYGGFYVARYEAGTSEITILTGTATIDFSAKNEANDWVNDNFSIRDGLEHTIEGKITCKAGEIPYYHADYFTALELSNRMYQTDHVQSGLVTGTMWDAIMKFIAGEDTSIVTTKCTWGNYNVPTEGVTFKAGQGRYATVDSGNGSMTSAFQLSDDKHHYGIRTTASTEGVKKKNLYDIAGNLWEWTQEAAYPNNTAESYMVRGGSFHQPNSSFRACYRAKDPATVTYTRYGFRPALFII